MDNRISTNIREFLFEKEDKEIWEKFCKVLYLPDFQLHVKALEEY